MKNEMIKKTGRKFAISMTMATLVVVVVVVVVVVGFLARKCTKDFEKTVVIQTQEHLLTIAQTQAKQIEREFDHIYSELKAFALNPTVQKRYRENIRSSEVPMQAYSPGVTLYAHLQDMVDSVFRCDSKGVVQSIRPFKV